MTHKIIIQLPSAADADALSPIAANHAASICDDITEKAPILATRLLYSAIYSYLYNMLLLSSPDIECTPRGAQLLESLGVILATAGINIDALISFSPHK